MLITRINAADAPAHNWASTSFEEILERPPQMDNFACKSIRIWILCTTLTTKMMSMWAQTDNEYGILSTYVTATENLPTLFEARREGSE